MSSVATDSLKNLVYLSDENMHVVRVINRTSNIISKVAGTYGVGGSTGDGENANSALLKGPTGIAVDSVNSLLYIADTKNQVVRVVNLITNVISTFAGTTGQYGTTGDNGVAIDAKLYNPQSVAVDTVNNKVYIADTSNYVVRVVSRPSMIIKVYAGTYRMSGSSGDGAAATNAKFYAPLGIAVDTKNSLVYIADPGNNVVRVVNSGGVISNFAGSYLSGYTGDGGAATTAKMNYPRAVAIDSSRNLVYIADTNNNVVRVVDRATSKINTFAGSTAGYAGDGGPASSAQLSYPYSLASDTRDQVYIADMGNRLLRAVNSSNNIISTVTGDRALGDNKLATFAYLGLPFDIAFDSNGNLVYIADTVSCNVRVINRTRNTISTLAGPANGQCGGSAGDGGPAASASFISLAGLALDSANGMLYISDSGSHMVRVVNLTSNNITIYAGYVNYGGSGGYSGDGGLVFMFSRL
jgi:DNA-binding beta-propeller fold protein YncE